MAAIVAAGAMVAGGLVLAGAPAASAIIRVDHSVDGCVALNYAAPAGTVFEVDLSGCDGMYDYWLAREGANPNASVFEDTPDLIYVTIGDGPGYVEVEGGPTGDSYADPYFGVCGGSRVGWEWDTVSFCPPTESPIPPWVQGYGRGSATDACKDGWTASWELWPHGGAGGWVCTREIPSLG
jgi:hypothetical protein